MPGLPEGNTPSYISFQSADLILSDVRPIKLKAEALHSINVFLDEFLYNIISAAGSLSTDKLRASLLHLLPTSLGKEALLEAEVELRAYWDRTGAAKSTTGQLEDDANTFHLPWAFELMQLKCVAYSTLNESDEDQGAEARINEKMTPTYGYPPKPTLLAPAALYLTAILEAMCEHILSNVGRVASRDSSKASATAGDLFIALCEDDNIYNLFKSMKVYDQIQQLSFTSRERRSKSFSTDPRLTPRTSSPAQDLSLGKSSSNTRSRLSSDGSTAISPTNSITRSSFEKARVMKKLMNNKTSSERESENQNGHKRSGSLASEQFDDGERSIHDEAMQQEFDDLMRSSSTMKVSLTPERLKTMEVHKQEKDQQGNRRPIPLLKSDSEILSSRPPTIRPSFRHVDSIIEEENSPPKQPKGPRARQASVATPPSAVAPGSNGSRPRSLSTSGTSRSYTGRAPSRTNPPPPPPSFPKTLPPPSSSKPSTPSMPSRNGPTQADNSGFPQRTRVRQRNRESIDLDDIMNGTDDEEPAPSPVKAPPRTTSKKTTPYVSASTRELIDFLAEGPPEPKISTANRELVDFLAQAPPDFRSDQNSSAISLDSNAKRKAGGGRLQRMISKLNIGHGEKSKNGILDSPSRSMALRPPTTPIQPPPTLQTLQPKSSAATLSSLANRPIPPRPPRPPSPPSSETHSIASIDKSTETPSKKPSVAGNTPPNSNGIHSPSITSTSTGIVSSREETEKSVSRATLAKANGTHGPAKDMETDASQLPIPPVVYVPQPQRMAEVPKSPPVTGAQITRAPSTLVRKPVPTYVPESPRKPPPLSETDINDMHRLLSRATTADECRLIFDMFVARRGLKIPPKTQNIESSYPSPLSSDQDHKQVEEIDSILELSMVELLLSGPPSGFFPGDDHTQNSIPSHIDKEEDVPRGPEPHPHTTNIPPTPQDSNLVSQATI